MTYTAPPMRGVQTLTTIPALSRRMTLILGAAPASSVAYPLANLALYVPFSVSEPITAYEGWVVTAATAGGNFDIGIYSAAGSRLTSSGATARVVSSINNTTAMTNYTMLPGLRYYMAFAADSVDLYTARNPAAGLFAACGVLEATSSYVLPTSPTLAVTTRAYMPMFGLNCYSVSL